MSFRFFTFIAMLLLTATSASIMGQDFVWLNTLEVSQVKPTGVIASPKSGLRTRSYWLETNSKNKKIGDGFAKELYVAEGARDYKRASGRVVQLTAIRLATGEEKTVYEKQASEKRDKSRMTPAERKAEYIARQAALKKQLSEAKSVFDEIEHKEIGRLRLKENTLSKSNVKLIGFGGIIRGYKPSNFSIYDTYFEFDRGAGATLYHIHDHYAIPDEYEKSIAYFLTRDDELVAVATLLLHRTLEKRVRRLHEKHLKAQKETGTTFALTHGILNYGKKRTKFNQPAMYVIDNWKIDNPAAELFTVKEAPDVEEAIDN